MADITTFLTLRTEIENEIDRPELADADVKGLVARAEEFIYNDPDLYRIRVLETDLISAIAGDGSMPFPTRWLAWRLVWIRNRKPLTPTSLEFIKQQFPDEPPGEPKMIARQANKFVFSPPPDDNYIIEGVYYQKPADLSADGDTNAYITNYTAVLLYQSLMLAAPFLGDDQRLVTWASLLEQIKDVLKRDSKSERASGGSLKTRRG